ncbi:MAG: sporulation protein YqfD [Halanaerobium sp.]|nr:sporulation protein YqfD [Halanaerobium sp.]
MRVRDWLLGEIEVELSGLALERLLNQFNQAGIRILGSRIVEKGVVIKVNPGDFRKIHHIIRDRSCRARIVKKSGLPFLVSRLFRRKMFVLGVMTALLLIYFSTSFVWFIEIQGLDLVSRQEIEAILVENGVHRGSLKSWISLEGLEAAVARHPRIIWAEATFIGTRLNVELAEKRIIAEADRPRNLVAAKDGIVTQVILLQGEQIVAEGQTVKQGDLLVTARNDIPPRAIIKARVWYEGNGIQPLQVYNYQLTGGKQWGYALHVGPESFHIWGRREPDYGRYRLQREVKSFSFWRNLNFPIELIKEIFLEVKEEQVNLAQETALILAEEEAYRQLVRSIPPDGKIIQVIVKEREVLNSRAVVRVLLEVEEEISQEQGREGDIS